MNTISEKKTFINIYTLIVLIAIAAISFIASQKTVNAASVEKDGGDFVLENEGDFFIPGVDENAKLLIDKANLESITAEYAGILHEGELPDESLVRVRINLTTGEMRDLEEFEAVWPKSPDFSYDIPIETEYGSTSLTISTVPIAEAYIDADSVYEGHVFYGSEARVCLVYEDGTMEYAQDVLLPDVVAAPDTVIHTETALRSLDFALDVIPVQGIVPSNTEDYYAGDVVDEDSITVRYEDGTEETFMSDEFTITEGGLLEAGDNEVLFETVNYAYTCIIHALPVNDATMARITYRDELENADYSYLSDTTFITITSITAKKLLGRNSMPARSPVYTSLG